MSIRLVIVCIFACELALALYLSRRNRDTRYVLPILPSGHDAQVIGDGAWKPDPRASSYTQARYPMSRANLRAFDMHGEA